MVLQSIRERLSGIAAMFIIGILVIPFAFVGVSSYFSSDSVNAVAVVNDQQISVSDFNQSFQQYRRQMQAQLGASFDPELFDQAIIRRQHLDSLIDEQLLVQVAEETGLAVDEQRLAQAILNVEAFHVDGEFNTDVYQARLTAQGMTPQSFENEMRASLIMNQFPRAVMTSSISTDWEVQDYIKLTDQTRAFEAILVPAQTPDEPPVDAEIAAEETTETTEDGAAAEVAETISSETISDEELLAWYDDHQGDYLSAEQVVFEYVELNAAFMTGQVEPTEDELRGRFENQQARFVTPEARLASHILFEVDANAPELEDETARQKAEEASLRARNGEDFATLAQELSEDLGSAEEGGDLGWIEPGFMVQAFEDGLYQLSLETNVSQPIKTGFGWHVIQLREIRPSTGMSFAEARDILLDEFTQESSERQFIEQADRLVDIIYEDPTTLQAAASELDLTVSEVGPVSRAGGEGIAANSEVMKAAFSELVLAQGAVSDPIDLGENHLVMILLKEHLPEALQPLEEVREQVAAAIVEDRASKAAEQRAESLLALMQGTGDVQQLAESEGLEFIGEEAAQRRSPGIDRILRQELFLMPRPEADAPVYQVVESNGGYAAVKLTAVTDGELPEGEQLASRAYQQRISNASATQEAYGFMRLLRAQSEIEVFEERL